MKALGIIGAAIAVMASPATAQMDFRGYTLGMTIEEFRGRETPVGWRGGPTRLACSDTDPGLTWLTPPDGYSEAGVISCSFVQTIGSSETRADLPMKPLDTSATVEFHFHDGRLYFIEVYMDAIHARAIDEALLAKLGPDPLTEERPFQTRAGAVFPQIVKTWRRGEQAAIMSTPDLTTQRMSVHYMDERASDEIRARIKAARNPASIM
jgi:hypothetical protein